eukprot:TRINITY_DN5403_c0_g1_i2.p1 TRINITY_DN5403_c0_g1~~TRINITY_DN5403_c0_g1_i2.p1  ORF type:complete len:1321 (-),score=360.16 TRINITY_DN5403_c0_g1_i2:49-3759(-)
MKDDIYTFTAYILIAINPFKKLAIYDDEVIARYKGKSIGVLPPHVFAVCDRAYRLMKSEKRSQSIIVSGESGAGKTETSKIVMRYLAAVGGKKGIGELEQRILEANPILEALGNAKTLRNNNSSRFGKFTEIHFNKTHHVCGAAIVTYLLEKSRLVFQNPGERNYHIFYQLLAGLTAEERAELKLQQPADYHYLSQSGCYEIAGVSDSNDFQRVRKAMAIIGLDEAAQKSIFRILAAILHLGNVEFTQSKRSDAAVMKEVGALETAAELLGCSASVFQDRLLTRTMKSRNEVISTPLNPLQAAYARDALAKSIYSKLFDFIVSRVCVSLKGEADDQLYFIGVLDIYGFEYFQTNSFEQLCINYANEKLQQHFNQQIFAQEQDIYEKEGIVYHKIDYADNQGCLDLIEKKGTGILSILDEEGKLPKGSNQAFTQKVHAAHPKNAYLKVPRLSKTQTLNKDEAFVVRHFAGEVCYNTTTGFLDKNNDALLEDLVQLIDSSNSELVRSLFAEDIEALKDQEGRKKKPTTVSSKFIKQLESLMVRLNLTASHFIRCIKPNTQQVSSKFEGVNVLEQLRCSGMMEALRLMHTGFPTRCPYDDLYDRYKDMMPPQIAELDSNSFCEALLMALDIPKKDYQMGITKIFFRAGKLAFLDDLRSSDYKELAPKIAEKVRKWLMKKKVRRCFRTVLAFNKLAKRLKGLRAFRRIRQTAVTILVISCTFMKRARFIKRRNAAVIIQAMIRGFLAHRRYTKNRKRATIVASRIRGYLARKEYRPKLRELKEQRLLRLKQEKEEAARQRAQQAAEEKRALQERLREVEERKKLEKALKAEGKALPPATAGAAASASVGVASAVAAAGQASVATAAQLLQRHELAQAIASAPPGAVLVTKTELEDTVAKLIGEHLKPLHTKISELEKELENEKSGRLALERAVTKLQEALYTQTALSKEESGPRAVVPASQAGAVAGGPPARPRAMTTSPSTPQLVGGPPPRPSMFTAASNTVPGPAVGGVVVPAPSAAAAAPAASTQVQNPMALLSQLHTAQKQDQPAEKPRVAIQQLFLEPIIRLQAVVDSIKSHFASGDDKAALGDDSTNGAIVRLVRGQLCVVLAKVLYYGFKSWKLIGRYHVWEFLENLQEKSMSSDPSAKISLVTAVGTINTLSDMDKKLDMKFRTLVCHLLNNKTVHHLIEGMPVSDPLVQKWFETYSFIRTESRDQIIAILRQLSDLPFILNLEYELSRMDM